MLDAGREALSFVKGRTRKDLEGNRMLVLSLVKEIEILGEAASRGFAGDQGGDRGDSLDTNHWHASPVDSCVLRYKSRRGLDYRGIGSAGAR
jgi:hypothetical protein